jgi:hypothetical protein
VYGNEVNLELSEEGIPLFKVTYGVSTHPQRCVKSHVLHKNVVPAPNWLTQRYNLCYYRYSLFKSKTPVIYPLVFVIFLRLIISSRIVHWKSYGLFLQNPFYSPLINNQASHSIYKESTAVLRYIELKSFSTTSMAALSQWWALGKTISWGPVLLSVFLKKGSYKLTTCKKRIYIIPLLRSVQTGSGAHPASYPIGTGRYFPGGKAEGAWSWLLTSV